MGVALVWNLWTNLKKNEIFFFVVGIKRIGVFFFAENLKNENFFEDLCIFDNFSCHVL